MLYDIKLTIGYQYETAANGGRHLLRMVPRTIDGVQRVVLSNLDCEPTPAERIDRTDFFGNATIALRFDDPMEMENFHMRARVERFPATVKADNSPVLSQLKDELHELNSVAHDSPHHFLASSTLVKPDTAVTEWALAFCEDTASVRSTAWRICSGLHEWMKFDPGATFVDTPLAEAFKARHGVCQDFTHIMIAALRALGIPAGYISGFLRTIPPEGTERLEGADAMHAWVRVWCGLQIGWVEFDPTNNMEAGEDHVIVAYGRDYFDVAPVIGNFRLSGSQRSSQSVDMIPL
ncbi:MAG: transglutaminase family protein [Zhengella sp.]|uniref:transglutaminase family protein n=1 Tax=Zhengella sp. TaxID=2282762 RepID=UPI003528E1A7|nr:transglutaminase family protein [Brucellaceae bacterium]